MILAGITLFEPDIERLKENVDSIITQVDYVLCVDNGSKNIEAIKKELSNLEKIGFVENKENLGVARALNQMYEYAEANGYEWVLTLDQDSVCPDNLIIEYQKYFYIPNMGMLCPIIKDRNYETNEDVNGDYQEVDRCITSAALTSVDTWKKVGKYMEELFIDMVDHEFCARLKKNHYKILQINSTCLLHEIGRGTEHMLLGVKLTALNHSSFRKYYMARNWYYYIKTYHDILNTRSEWIKYYFFFVKTFIYENNKLKKLKVMIKGRKDGKKLVKERRNA